MFGFTNKKTKTPNRRDEPQMPASDTCDGKQRHNRIGMSKLSYPSAEGVTMTDRRVCPANASLSIAQRYPFVPICVRNCNKIHSCNLLSDNSILVAALYTCRAGYHSAPPHSRTLLITPH